jgi:hypothetical protein
MPDSGIYGVKFETRQDDPANKVTITFTTLHQPVWGDFYAVDGKKPGSPTYAYNTGFGIDPGCVAGGSCGSSSSISGLDRTPR